ncbi:MAG: helix-turn-helix transcriptional regulator, partial [Chloroflexota bacterium]|nr:helix-turn-helix transcriptional regulator [Chloroflexota bacterium]
MPSTTRPSAKRPARTRPIDANASALAERVLVPARNEDEVGRLLAAADDLTRIRMIRALAETPLAAGDLARITGRTPSGASQHIRALREVGAVVAERHGNVVRYRLSSERSARILEAIAR